MEPMDIIGKTKEDASLPKVFVRLRPMNRKEKEAGSRGCVRVANGSDIYLTEFAKKNDYLRLNRLRGRHFTLSGE